MTVGPYRTGVFITDQTVNDVLFYKKCLGWELKFTWLPKRCDITGEKIWLKLAYRGTAVWRAGDNIFISEHRWHDKCEHIIWQLKK